MERIIAGFDEAGRGCVIGPLVIAGVSVPEAASMELRKIGVKDSKLLTPEKRESLAKSIEKLATDIVVLKIGPCKIDNYRRQNINLNRLESIKFAEAINLIGPHEAFVDAPDTNTERMQMYLRKLMDRETGLVVEHFADKKYPVVGAASIIAKTIRDEEIRKLRDRHGDFGSGYTSDEKTIRWLRGFLEARRKFPEKTVRETWDTIAVLKREFSQSRLSSWLSDTFRKPMESVPEDD